MASVNHHFKVDFTARHTVKASHASVPPNYTLPLSNLDLLAGRSSVAIFCAYQKPEFRDFSSLVAAILASLAETLNHYFPLSGRLVTNPTTDEPEILCNNEGVEVAEAHAHIDLGSLDFYDLTNSLQQNLVPTSQEMPLRIQVTSFNCGGFSIAWSIDHALADATSFVMFLASWSEIVQTKALSMPPDHRRSIIRPRSPLKFSPSIDNTFIKFTIEDVVNMVPMTGYDISLKRMFFIQGSHLNRLQQQASKGGRRATKIEAFSAYLWKILAESIKESDDIQSCKMGWLVEGRRWMVSQNVTNLFGNLLSMAVGEADIQELKQAKMSQIASIAHDAIAEASSDEHFTNLIDWVEFNRPGMFLAKILAGFEGPAIVISSALGLPVKQMDFGFGSPVFGTQYTTIARLGAGYVGTQPTGLGDGSWLVFTILWPELVKALETDPNHVFKPVDKVSIEETMGIKFTSSKVEKMKGRAVIGDDSVEKRKPRL
ncbi:hypothetical protein Sjap_020051 [Stephania japonica]|uniref:Uncharacterized protein n=1 Tax=Stephania japonica TaxID=461633 RepID=A0AAP0F5H5_9MAGN